MVHRIYTVYMCCAGLLALDPGTAQDGGAFQVNRAMFEAPLSKDQLYTVEGDRFFFSATLRDSTGAVEVFVVEKASDSFGWRVCIWLPQVVRMTAIGAEDLHSVYFKCHWNMSA